MHKYTLAFALLVSLSSFAKTSVEQTAAMKDVQNTITDPAKRKEIISADPKAKSVDDMVSKLAGENSGELYALSADILPILMEMNQDNPEKALESLTSYSKDPASFMSSLPPNIRERIEKLSKKIEGKVEGRVTDKAAKKIQKTP
ncbi:MAG: hypothetical protein B7Y39_02135 [Bdellovibrio sp. 28-41-41]|nr:MAG: hypothetical protein B7Y39_02135 [Bdellovibrio sp. 28-41-41]